MTKVYKTARGKTIDMDKVKLANETVNAVGNMKVNARGDRLGGGGKVIAGRNQVMDQVYAVNPAPARRTGGYSPNDPEVYAQQQSLVESNRAKELHDLATNLVQPTSIEPVEAAEPAARGSLASSVAKTAVVKQEPMPNPKTSNGPTRI
jgi:hypothetical protein